MQDFIEFDPDYEFDAARFYDFTSPESLSDSEEAERWFRFAPSYPPSRKHLHSYFYSFYLYRVEN